MASPIGSRIVANSGIVVARGDVFANVLAGGAHPAAGTGGTWFDAETATIWDDEAGTDPAELTEGEAIVRVDTNEFAVAALFLHAPASLRYSPATHATPNGKPAVYTVTDGIGTLGQYQSAAGGVIAPASTELSGRPFGRVMVLKRLSTTDNVGICAMGSNRPMNSRTVLTNAVSIYGFVSGFVSGNSATWVNGTYAVIAYRWNEATAQLQVSINGGAWSSSGVGDTGWVPDGGSISIGAGAYALAFDWYFDGNPDALIGYPDLATFIAAIGLYYGL